MRTQSSRCSTSAVAFCLLSAALSAPCGSEGNPDTTRAFTRTLYLIRHGAYDASQKTESEAGPGLTPLGIAQARMIAERLKALSVPVSSITASTMLRAEETAQVIEQSLPSVPRHTTPLLRECTPPAADPRIMRETGAKEAAECEKQLDDAFSTFFTPAQGRDESDVLVCHGNVIRYFVMKALGVDTKAWSKMSVAHASVTVIRVRVNGSMTVLSVGDIGHIPPSLESWGNASDPQLVVPTSVTKGPR